MSRRRVLAGLGATGTVALAGCLGDGESGDGGDGNSGDGDGGGDGGGNSDGDGSGNGDGDGNAGENDGPEQGINQVGEVVTGEYVSFMIEYVRPIDHVRDFHSFSRTSDDEPYGAPLTVDHYIEQRFVEEGAEFYGVGFAVKNTHDTAVDAATIMGQDENGEGDLGGFGVFPGRTQRLSFRPNGRGGGRPILPGQLLRGEVVLALSGDPSNYTLTFMPYPGGLSAPERLLVDLGEGSEATASFTQDPPVSSLGQPVAVGDFDATLHGVERVPSIEDSPHQDLFGPRPGFDYLRIDLSATRTSDVMIGQDWSIGIADDEGHAFSWNRVYQDALELNRTRLEELSVGESLEHVTLAFPIEEEFDPTYLAMHGPGPIEDPPKLGASQGMQGVLWGI